MDGSGGEHGFDLRRRLHEREEAGLRRDLAPVDEVSARARTATDPGGESPVFKKEALIFAANNYLGLAGDSRVADAAERAAREIGTGAGASRLIVGDTPAHRSLERSLAEKKDTERALAFSSGYAANVGTITALDPDVIFSDELNHASITDGVRLSGAEVEVYDHCDPGSLADAMAARGDSASVAESWLVVVPELGVGREIRGYHRNSGDLGDDVGEVVCVVFRRTAPVWLGDDTDSRMLLTHPVHTVVRDSLPP